MSSQSSSATKPSHAPTYSSQVVLPFGDFINHLSGVAVDTADNVYVLDLHYGQVWRQEPHKSHPTALPFTDLGRSVDVAADFEGNLYVVDDLNNRVLKLAPGTTSPTVLPFNELNRPSAVAVDTAGNVYVADSGDNPVMKLAAGGHRPT